MRYNVSTLCRDKVSKSGTKCRKMHFSRENEGKMGVSLLAGAQRLPTEVRERASASERASAPSNIPEKHSNVQNVVFLLAY